MMSETSAGHTGHETGTGSLTPSGSDVERLPQWQRYAIEYKTAISASIGAAVSAVVGYFTFRQSITNRVDSPLV